MRRPRDMPIEKFSKTMHYNLQPYAMKYKYKKI
jgi:hypothetical protein